jgi:opacity protein-like surface antigen
MFRILLICIFITTFSQASDIFYHVNNRIYEEENFSHNTIIHEPQGTVRLYNNKPETIIHKNPLQPQVFISAGLGAHYIYSPPYSYINSGTTTNRPAESYSHTMLPIGIEASFPTKTRIIFGLGGHYYFNPFTNSSELNTTGTKIFTAETKYMLYGKVGYAVNEVVSLYTLLGVTGVNLTVYNDTTNALFSESTINAPSFGLGFSLNMNDHLRLFVDGVYSYLYKTGAEYNGIDPHLYAISQKKYHSFQGRVGIAFDITSLMD